MNHSNISLLWSGTQPRISLRSMMRMTSNRFLNSKPTLGQFQILTQWNTRCSQLSATKSSWELRILEINLTPIIMASTSSRQLYNSLLTLLQKNFFQRQTGIILNSIWLLLYIKKWLSLQINSTLMESRVKLTGTFVVSIQPSWIHSLLLRISAK